MNKALDNLFERVTKILGSTLVIIGSVTWCVWAYISGSREFLDVVSMVTFIFGELILRGQNVQDERQEAYIKQAVKDTKKDLKISNAILKEVREQRFQR